MSGTMEGDDGEAKTRVGFQNYLGAAHTAQRSPSLKDALHRHSQTTTTTTAIMPPMSFTGVVTKVGAMQKTATVTVSRWVVHERTRKVAS